MVGGRRDTWVPPYNRFCRARVSCRECGALSAGGQRRPPLRESYKWHGGAGRCGERTERCQWQKKRSERVAAVKISSVRRKAAQKFWAPQQDHRPLRMRCRKCGEVGDRKGRPYGKRLPLSGEPLGDADCHSQCAHWLRNDRFFARSAVRNRRADRVVRPYGEGGMLA